MPETPSDNVGSAATAPEVSIGLIRTECWGFSGTGAPAPLAEQPALPRASEGHPGPRATSHSPLSPMRSLLFLPAALLLSACSMSGGMARSGAPMAAQTAMTDADILKVFMTSNDGEIVTSQAVVGDAQSAEVRQFAQMMITDHTALNDRARALGIEPRDNQVAASMRQNATAKAAQIDAMSGAMKDRTYMETQVVLHGNTLDMLTNVLIPNARDARLRALLTEARPSVEQHFRRAQQIHHAMM